MKSLPSARRRRSVISRLLPILLLLSLASVACGATAVTTESARSPEPTPVPAVAQEAVVQDDGPAEPTADPTSQPAPAAAAPAAPESTPTPHPIAAADTELAPAPIGFDNLFDTGPTGPQPISMQIENIGVGDATVIPVGVNEDLTFEVPPADQIGWYEFGSTPGEAGSAVLAAHIAYNGVDGVFRYLEDVEIGSIVVIGFDDDTTKRYRIEEVTEYVKEALPDSLFARDGKEQLALITCGGTFNYDLDSYESNTVAIAVPV